MQIFVAVSKDFFTCAEAAEYMHTNVTTVYRYMRQEDGIPHSRVGRQWVIPKGSLYKWLYEKGWFDACHVQG